jgi:hypothetical protein
MRSTQLFRTSFFLLCIIVPNAIFSQTANHVVISEIYGSGGNTGASYCRDFIELYNPASVPVDLAGWSVQYAAATSINWKVTALTGSIAAYGFYLVQEDSGGTAGAALPAPDAIGTINLSGTHGKIILCSSATALNDSNPSGVNVIDKVGYGSANGYEGSAPASYPSSSNAKSIERKARSSSTALLLASGGTDAVRGNGYDSDDNSADFVIQANINPQNSSADPETPVVDFIEPNFKNSVDAEDITTLNNYPNPFNPSTEITFAVARRGTVTLKVYDMLGRLVATLFDAAAEKNRRYTVTFNASRLCSGIYLSELNSSGAKTSRKMMLLK